jgi:hypothetical protein
MTFFYKANILLLLGELAQKIVLISLPEAGKSYFRTNYLREDEPLALTETSARSTNYRFYPY